MFALAAAAARTAGHGPIFFANGCEAPKPPRYTSDSATVATGPAVRSHWRPATIPAAASTAPPSGRIFVSRATT